MHRLLRKVTADCTMRAIAFSHDGSEIIIGCGGDASGEKGRKDGAFMIIDFESMKVKFEGWDSKQFISTVKFSPDSKVFALVAEQQIFLYDNNENYTLRSVIKGHNERVTAIDFASDSSVIQSDSVDFEHLKHDTNDGGLLTHPSKIKDITWFSHNCKYSYPIQGIHDIQFKPSCVDRSGDQKHLAVGTHTGQINLYNYPVVVPKSRYSSQGSHVGEIAKCCFNCESRYLVSIGKSDRSILIWELKESQ